MHQLLINPNTRHDLTHSLVQAAQGDVPLLGETAAFGADYIASEAGYAVAAHAALDAYERHAAQHGRPTAVLVGCFGDPGVWALREMAEVPVMGLAEAAMREADALGPFAIVTGGKAWGPMLARLARSQGITHLRRVITIDAGGDRLLAEPTAAVHSLQQAIDRACLDTALAAVVLGGAALTGFAPKLSASLPLIDSVQAGSRWLRSAPMR
ncbi:aspartate/glutamate racemase family protein [Piscinibacter terrae]|uniref:Asp/Glu racemase n=1 Tax=Piscinibacter terrae TaxID=2496871 RepID=A0A3N7HNU3_9BURK|nr:aspartate/glutamate racemase family protein [Albitalea terrae]RQP22776.1 Asp/Glu racemase [Albitalea terrae]